MRVVLVVVTVLTLAGCGRKLPPLPPILDVPETTQDLSVYQDGHNVVLTWSYPKSTRAGRPLLDLERIEVLRLDLAPGQELPPAPELRRQLMVARGRVIARLEGSGLAAATAGSFLRVEDALQLPVEGSAPSTSWYAVRSRRRDGTPSALSNLVSWQGKPVPAAVDRLVAVPSPEGVLLSWSGVAGATYLLERQDVAGGGWYRVGGEEVKGTEYRDGQARQGTTWRYRVRAVVEGVRGPFSGTQEVGYPDIYPPPPPTSLVCLPEATRVRLSWEGSPESGVSYRLERRRAGEDWQVAGEMGQRRALDDADPPEGELEYRVMAVDGAGNASTSVACSVRMGP